MTILPNDLPNDLGAFLLVLKDKSEAIWADYKTMSFEDFVESGVGGSSWRAGTRWQQGLDTDQIDEIEQKWSLKFPPEYRIFLSVLNAVDRGTYSVGWRDDPPYDMAEDDDQPSYFDWTKDYEALKDALNWPLEGLLFDVENNDLWLESWGARPQSETDRNKELERLVTAAPRLIPITGHRYIIENSTAAQYPVLSVWGSDIICYGSNLRNFLLLEFSGAFGLDHRDLSKVANEGITEEQIAAIPFWGELILRN